jgi:predicted O-linked N-acetylglucosamine transferase (SPINDLY family)
MGSTPDRQTKAAQLQQAQQLHQQGRLAAAEALYQKVLQTEPANFDALYLLGVAARQRNRNEVALDFFQRALNSNPVNVQLLYNCGNLLADLGRHADALACYERAVALKPDYVKALGNQGIILQRMQRHDEALDCFAAALKLQPDDPVAHAGRALTLQQMKRYAEAATGYAQALSLQPDHPWLSGNRLHSLMNICQWIGFESEVQRLVAGISADKPVVHPFDALAIPLSAGQQRQCARIYACNQFPPQPPAATATPPAARQRIRLGYFSTDLYQHATAHLMAGLFEQHDRSRFEVIAFSFGPSKPDPMRQRLQAAFDQFHEVGHLADKDIAGLAAKLGIDIAIDLKGYTQHARTGIFARRAAPLQVNYLGYPGTMAADYIDYLIADPTVIPPEHIVHYSEKIVWLPHCYQVNDDSRAAVNQRCSRQEAGLPEKGFVFCCFNNNWKITPPVFSLWMRLLKQVAGSVLWLLEDNPLAAINLRNAAQQHGVDAARLVFAPRTTLQRHLARHQVADLFLDTLPYNAHTTASDALWSGLPIITRPGETFASRVAASLLKAVGLPELITDSAEAYVALALERACDAPRLAALRQRLGDNRLTRPLFDTRLFARHIEAGYTAMWQRHLAGLPPDHIVVPIQEKQTHA